MLVLIAIPRGNARTEEQWEGLTGRSGPSGQGPSQALCIQPAQPPSLGYVTVFGGGVKDAKTYLRNGNCINGIKLHVSQVYVLSEPPILLNRLQFNATR